ncbi:MAG: CBS domain-containing protein [Cyanobacterium sp. T60_A2020_053]|nr:CBS domain-containing protein [Cyanobacterium sp. T60_A2020_053]
MDIILCHQTADFDALGASVGLTILHPGAKFVLVGSAHPSVKNFLALHRDELPLIEFRSVNPKLIRRIFIVDTQKKARLGKAQEWLELPQLESITVYDHHPENDPDLPTTFKFIENVGSSSTIITELLQKENITPNPIQATVMALGIHVDTGSLTFEQSCARDALALAWLMGKGANIALIAEYVEPSLSPQLPAPVTATDLMSSPVRTIPPDTSIEEAQRILLRYGHSGLLVMTGKELTGIISRRDIDIALHHGFAHAPVKGYMSKNLLTITTDTPLSAIESLMVNNDIGRLPVLKQGELVGIVTRSDILYHLRLNDYDQFSRQGAKAQSFTDTLVSCLLPSFQQKLNPHLWELLQKIAHYAQQQGWHLYLVGGAVRDLLLSEDQTTVNLQDIDLVVDGFHGSHTSEAGVILAKALQKDYPEARLSVHGEFQTAALLWHKDDNFGSLWLDIATARTEFYPYPASNPQVEASSIRQDLYRRDFSMNALALRLTNPRQGELLDFFGGVRDLKKRLIRVLHANSFIEDPTRIFRGVRFAARLNFTLESQTVDYIKYAVNSGVFERISLQQTSIPALTTRLRTELIYILQADYWQSALRLLSDLGALSCLHPQCVLTPSLWWQLRCGGRWLRFYQLLPQRQKYAVWLMRLELILSGLSRDDGVKVAQNLDLPQDTINRLKYLAQNQKNVNIFLSKNINRNGKMSRKGAKAQSFILSDSPDLMFKSSEVYLGALKVSEVVQELSKYQSATLILIAVKSDKYIRKVIWQYLFNWSQLEPIINGNDLKDLGYKPSPIFKQILTEVQGLFLDGEIQERGRALDFVQENYLL